MKTSDLLVELNKAASTWGDCEIWLVNDMLMRAVAVEVWHKPHFEEPTIVFRAEISNFELLTDVSP